MSIPDWVNVFLTPLDRIDVRYMVTGGVASIAWGEPRLTLDVDVVVDLPRSKIASLVAVFDPERFYVPPTDVLTQAARRDARGFFNIIDMETGLKGDFYVSGRDPVDAWAWDHRHAVTTNDGVIWFAAPEYVILRKLEFHREGGSSKHLRDIASMLRMVDPLDRVWLDREVTRLGLDDTWRTLVEESERA